MPQLHRLLPLVLAIALTGMALGDRGSGDAPKAIPAAELSLIARSPRDFLGQELSLAIQVESQPVEWNPYLTRFGTEDYRAVIAWGDEQRLWDRTDYANPAAMLLVRRGSALEPILIQAQRYARFEATGIVRQVLVGRPWIEITSLRALSEQFSPGSMVHAARGVELMAAEHWELAAQSFERALASDLPARAQTELERLRSESLARVPKLIEIPPKKELRINQRAVR